MRILGMNRDMTYLTACMTVLYGTVWLLAGLWYHGGGWEAQPIPFFNHGVLWALGLTGFFGFVHLAALHEMGKEN